jgi:hypothetical protein
MLTHPQLMARIEQYSFDNPETSKPAFGFLDRLCVETGWGRAFAQGAIREYRRFVYLATTGNRPVTPSREVDAVWHLHLTYTRSYWERLRAILPRDLHHEPTPGGHEAASTYRAQYAETKARYLAEFGDVPPDDFWPPEDERFQPDMRQMRGTRSSGAWPLGGRLAAGVAVATAVAATATPAFAADGLSGQAIAAIVIGTGITIALASVAFLSRMGTAKAHNKKKKDQGDGGSVYYGGDGGSSSGGKGGKDGGESGGEGNGGEGGGDGGGGGCGGGGCGSS